MPLDPGKPDASSGMSQAIYDKINATFSANIPQEILDAVQQRWKELAYAIAFAVADHIQHNMEIEGIQAGGEVDLQVSGDKAKGTIEMKQTGPTTGHVK